MVLLSAQKHHFSFAPYVTFNTCNEDLSGGDGPVFVPDSISHVPLFDASSLTLMKATAFPAPGGGWYNVCDTAHGGPAPIATHLHPNSLDDLGFPGESLLSGDPFTGGLGADGNQSQVSPVWQTLIWGGDFSTDADGDGRYEVDAVLEHQGEQEGYPVRITVTSNDPCPIDHDVPGELDVDHDGIPDLCDPDSTWKQTFVARGTSEFPAVPPISGSAGPFYEPWYKYHTTVPAAPRAGWLDTDQDTSPDGEDLCPSVQGSDPDDNDWGENANWKAGTDDNFNAGAFERGDMCDPYPVESVAVHSALPSHSVCNLDSWQAGKDEIPIDVLTWEGKSANGASQSEPTVSQQIYRCACRDSISGGPSPDCLDDLRSDCYRLNLATANRTIYDGHGWRPAARPGCSVDTTSWCGAYDQSVAVRDERATHTSWDWTTEFAQYGETSPTAHFAPSDFTSYAQGIGGGAYLRSNYQYAFWVESNIKQSLGAPGSNPFPDPENTSKGAALQNVQSVESRRLRARFPDTRATLESKHTARPTIFIACPTQGSLGLWGLIDLDLVRVFGPRGGGGEPQPIGPQLLAASGDRFSQAYVLRPAQGTLAHVDLGPGAAESWIATATGTGALFARSLAVGRAGPAWRGARALGAADRLRRD